MNAKCPQRAAAAAYLAAELSPDEHGDYEAHLCECVECRAAVESTRRLTERLRALPRVEMSRDLAPEILKRMREVPRELAPAALWGRRIAFAATIALLAGAAAFHASRTPPVAPMAVGPSANQEHASLSRAIDWLCEHQEADGSWNANKWGGQPRFEVALTALPMLAIASSDSATPAHSAAISRASVWLRQRQTSSGSFGPEFSGAPYNSSIATLALLRAYLRQPEAATRGSLDAALTGLLAHQSPEGAWGYAHTARADRSITEWHAEALELAAATNWPELRSQVERAHAWLRAHSHLPATVDEPFDSPSAALPVSSRTGGTLDFYQAYFETARLQAQGDASSLHRLTRIRHTLLERQVSGGIEAGTWPPDDRWGRAGGRLYSTALAALALRTQ